MQRTVQREVAASGIGLFTGASVSLKLSPLPPNSGVVFQRTDLPNKPTIAAKLCNVKESPRCTTLSQNGASVQMVEHILSALSAFHIDNLKVEVDGPEIVAGDGSAQIFVDCLEKAGIQEQDVERKYLKIQKPIFFSEGDVHIIGLPSDEFKISYTLHYPQPELGSQYYTTALTPKEFKEQIAPCRTFSLYEEIAPFIEKGIIRGGGLDNALIFKEGKIMNPGGARFPNEMARHKVLDLIGDLFLAGPILGHVIAIRSGHASHVAFARKLEC